MNWEEVIRDDAGSIAYHLNIDRSKLQPYIDDMDGGLKLLSSPIDVRIKERFGMIEVQLWLHTEVDGVTHSQLFRNYKCFYTKRSPSGAEVSNGDYLTILYYTVRETLEMLNKWIKFGRMIEELPQYVYNYITINKDKLWVTGEYLTRQTNS